MMNPPIGDAVEFERMKRDRITGTPVAPLMNAAADLLAACEAQERVDEHIANCDECCDEVSPGLCEEGFPLADDARTLRRAALAKARGEGMSRERAMMTTDTRPKLVPILLPVWVIERLAKLNIEMQRVGATGEVFATTADRWAEEAGLILAAISDAQVIDGAAPQTREESRHAR